MYVIFCSQNAQEQWTVLVDLTAGHTVSMVHVNVRCESESEIEDLTRLIISYEIH